MTDQEWPPRPYDAETCRRRLKFLSDHFASHPDLPKVDKGMRGALIGAMNGVFRVEEDKDKGDAGRHTVLSWLFGDPTKRLKTMSTKELTEGQWYALHKWISLTRNVDERGKIFWLSCPEFGTEALYVLNAALRQHQREQIEMEALAGLEELNG